ncbi:MAG: hypothetical protein ACRD32_03000 [Nitrososphaerales archaeon]
MFLKSKSVVSILTIMNEHLSRLKRYIDGTLIVMSGLAWHGVVVNGADMKYPLVITAISLAVILGLRLKTEKALELTR